MVVTGVIERRHPGVFIVVAAAGCAEQRLRAALAWGGPDAAGPGRSAGAWYGLEGVCDPMPVVAVDADRRLRGDGVVVQRVADRRSLMVRRHRGLPVTGVEATLLALAAELNPQELEIAAEDARRRRLTSVPAMRAYLERFGRSGRDYFYDFAFLAAGVILEVNGRRYHDDPTGSTDHRNPASAGRMTIGLQHILWTVCPWGVPFRSTKSDAVNLSPGALTRTDGARQSPRLVTSGL